MLQHARAHTHTRIHTYTYTRSLVIHYARREKITRREPIDKVTRADQWGRGGIRRHRTPFLRRGETRLYNGEEERACERERETVAQKPAHL